MPSISKLVQKNQELQASGNYVREQPGSFQQEASKPPESLPGVTVTGLPIRGVFNPNQILDDDFIRTTTGMRTSSTLRSPTFPPQPTSTAVATKTTFNAETAIAAAQKAGNAAALEVFSGLNMDTIPEGQNFGKPKQTALTVLGNVNPALSGFTAQGSIPVAGANGFTYTATTSSITWTWPSTIYRADGTTTTIPAGTQAVTGLATITAYNFYPFWNEATSTLEWVSDATAVGTPTYAFTGESSTSVLIHSQTQNLQGNIPLTGGPLMGSTVASGSGGGSGGGTRYCVREDMFVETRRAGVIQIKDVVAGDELSCPDIGWTTVQSVETREHYTWIRIQTHHNGVIIVTPSHHITLQDGTGKAAETLGLMDIIQVADGADSIEELTVLHVAANKVKLYCEPEHRFYAGQVDPKIVAHNTLPIS